MCSTIYSIIVYYSTIYISDSHQLLYNWFPQKNVPSYRCIHFLSFAHKAIYYNSPPYFTYTLVYLIRRRLTSKRYNADKSLMCDYVSYLNSAFSYIFSIIMELPPCLYYINPFTPFLYYTSQGLHIINVIYSLI